MPACAESERYDTVCSWKKYCYDLTLFHYQGTYEMVQPGACQARGLTSDTEHDLFAIESSRRCEEAQWTCEDRWQAESYSCAVDGGTPFSSSKSLNGMSSCEAPKNYSCQQFVDGESIQVTMARAQALASGASCTPILDAMERIDVNSSAADSPGFRGCRPYSCNIDGYKKVRIGERTRLGAPDRYAGCVAAGQAATGSVPFAVDSGADGKIRATTAACPSGTADAAVSPPVVVRSSVCAAELAGVTLPAGLTARKTGVSTTTRTRLSFTETSPIPLADSDVRARVAANAGIEPAGVTVTGSSSQAIAGQCAATELYPPGDPYRQSPGFVAHPPVVRDKIADDSPLIAELDQLLGGLPRRAPFATCVDAVSASGRHERCKRTTVATTSLAPTGANLLQVAKTLRPDLQLTWNAIVNLDGKSCAGPAGAAAKGDAYMELAAGSNGAVADICAPTFDGFMAKLAELVTTEPETTYPLGASAGRHVLFVENLTNGKRLEAGTDYTIEKETIVFAAGRVRKGDEIRIEWAAAEAQ
jgi:hypothetical protein